MRLHFINAVCVATILSIPSIGPSQNQPEKPDMVITESSSASTSTSASRAGEANAPRPAGKYFKFRIESQEGQPLVADVHHVDLERGRAVATYQSNKSVDLSRPRGKMEYMPVVCSLFGYRESHKYIDYANPSRGDDEAYLDSDGAWVIPYRLDRVEAGDVSVMYNVSFYKDAVVMRKSSRAELDELVGMMQSNPYYEIIIHSHCNGTYRRNIIAPGASRNYFGVAGSVEVSGPAKKLTTLRAQAIKAYLMDNGIDPSRLKIRSWGASDMLVKPERPDASINDRIEIEFTRD